METHDLALLRGGHAPLSLLMIFVIFAFSISIVPAFGQLTIQDVDDEIGVRPNSAGFINVADLISDELISTIGNITITTRPNPQEFHLNNLPISHGVMQDGNSTSPSSTVSYPSRTSGEANIRIHVLADDDELFSVTLRIVILEPPDVKFLFAGTLSEGQDVNIRVDIARFPGSIRFSPFEYPDWSYNPNTGRITGLIPFDAIPGNSIAGGTTVLYDILTDDGQVFHSDRRTFHIFATDRPPFSNNDVKRNFVLTIGGTNVIDITDHFTDPDGDDLDYKIRQLGIGGRDCSHADIDVRGRDSSNPARLLIDVNRAGEQCAFILRAFDGHKDQGERTTLDLEFRFTSVANKIPRFISGEPFNFNTVIEVPFTDIPTNRVVHFLNYADHIFDPDGHEIRTSFPHRLTYDCNDGSRPPTNLQTFTLEAGKPNFPGDCRVTVRLTDGFDEFDARFTLRFGENVFSTELQVPNSFLVPVDGSATFNADQFSFVGLDGPNVAIYNSITITPVRDASDCPNGFVQPGSSLVVDRDGAITGQIEISLDRDGPCTIDLTAQTVISTAH